MGGGVVRTKTTAPRRRVVAAGLCVVLSGISRGRGPPSPAAAASFVVGGGAGGGGVLPASVVPLPRSRSSSAERRGERSRERGRGGPGFGSPAEAADAILRCGSMTARGFVDGVGVNATGGAAAGAADSLDAFARDVDHVMNDLRGGPDMTIPQIFRGKPGKDLVMSNVFTLEMWSRHTSRWRYLRYLLDFPTSRLLRLIYSQMVTLTVWSVIAVLLESGPNPLVKRFKVPLTPLSLISTFVGALITMRSNQGLARLAEGRVAWGRVIMLVRDTSQLLAQYVYPVNQELGLFAARHISMFGWLHKCFLREEDDADIVTAMLPRKSDADFILGQRKHPAAALSRLRQILAGLLDRGEIPPCAHRAIEFNLLELNRVVGMCERLKGSMIPPFYTAHASRLLLFYFIFLPLALHGTLSGPLTVLVTTVVGYSVLGLDEVGHVLEMPFRLMPLHQQAGNAMMDSMEAFVRRPPPLPGAEAEASLGECERGKRRTGNGREEQDDEEEFAGYARLSFDEGPEGDAGVDADLLD